MLEGVALQQVGKSTEIGPSLCRVVEGALGGLGADAIAMIYLRRVENTRVC